MSDPVCTCEAPGYCPHWDRYLTLRMLLAVQGSERIPAQERGKWLAAFRRERGRQSRPVPQPQAECIHLGPRIHPSKAPGTVRTYYECRHPQQPLGPVVCRCRGCNQTCQGFEEV